MKSEHYAIRRLEKLLRENPVYEHRFNWAKEWISCLSYLCGCKQCSTRLKANDVDVNMLDDLFSISDIRIRKVKVLQGRAKAEAVKLGLAPNDLVIVTTRVHADSLSEYHIEKIDGAPVSFLLTRKHLEEKELNKNE